MSRVPTDKPIQKVEARPLTRADLMRPPADTSEVRGLLDRMKGQFAAALPKHITVERLIRVAMTQLQAKPRLMECTTGSLLACIVEAAALGLEPGTLGHSYLVPFRNKGVMTCTLIHGYKGLMDLAWRSAQLSSIEAHCVYQGDEFDYAFGSKSFVQHKPVGKTSDKEITHAWAGANLKSGGFQFVVLTRSEVDGYRARSRSKDDGAWVTDYAAMARKTAVRRLATFLPMSVEFRRAAANDEAAETGFRQALESANLLQIPMDAMGPADEEPDDNANPAGLTAPKEKEKPAAKDEAPPNPEGWDREATVKRIGDLVTRLYPASKKAQGFVSHRVIPHGTNKATDVQLREAEAKLRAFRDAIEGQVFDKPDTEDEIGKAFSHIEKEIEAVK